MSKDGPAVAFTTFLGSLFSVEGEGESDLPVELEFSLSCFLISSLGFW